MARDIPRPKVAAGAVSRYTAYDLVAQYLAAVPDAGDDARVWRAVDLALDASGLPPMTAPALAGVGLSVAAAAAGLLVADRVAYAPPAPQGARPYRPDELHGGRIGTRNDGESPHWRNLVDEHGLGDARDVVLGRITAGGPITGLPASWEDHLDWAGARDLGDEITARRGLPFSDGELALLNDRGVPTYAVAAILCRGVDSIEKKRQRLTNGRPD